MMLYSIMEQMPGEDICGMAITGLCVIAFGIFVIVQLLKGLGKRGW